MRKISIRKIIVFVIYILFILIILASIIKILFMGKKTLDIKITNTIVEYEYTINNNATDYHKRLFNELSTLLTKDNFSEKEYAELISKIFITELYTLDNKLNKNDIGGTQYVYPEFRDDFNSIVQSTIYKNIKNNMYGNRIQELPIVKEVKIETNNIDNFEYNQNVLKNSYYIEATIQYEKDLDYPNKVSLVLIKNNNKLEIAKMETE